MNSKFSKSSIYKYTKNIFPVLLTFYVKNKSTKSYKTGVGEMAPLSVLTEGPGPNPVSHNVAHKYV